VNNENATRWAWEVSARYALREPTDTALANVQTAAARVSVERRWGTALALRLALERVNQISGEPDLRGSANQGAVGLVWSPRGRV
jgi:hypothetical protein